MFNTIKRIFLRSEPTEPTEPAEPAEPVEPTIDELRASERELGARIDELRAERSGVQAKIISKMRGD